MEGVCNFCKKEGTKFRCGKCKSVYYCSKDCQVKDWKEHKLVCGKTQKQGSTPFEEELMKYGSKDVYSTGIGLQSFFNDPIVSLGLKYSKEKGRYLVSKRDLPRGSIVLAADAYEKVPIDGSLTTSCYNCLKEVQKPFSTCSKCHICYCSQECYEDSEYRHQCNCEGMCCIQGIELPNDTTIRNTDQRIEDYDIKDDHILFFDRDLLRLFVHIMNRFQYELKDKKERLQGYKYNIHYRDVFELYSHQKEIEDTYKQWNQALCEEMKSIYLLLKPLFPMPLSTMTRILLILRYNSTPIQSYQKTIGLCLYPVICYLNHSCIPNVVLHYSHNGDTMVVRALRDIKQNEELCYSYIDVLNTYQERQTLLQKSFLFDCHCPRCQCFQQKDKDGGSKDPSMIHDELLEELVCNHLHCTEHHIHDDQCFCHHPLSKQSDTYQCPKCSSIYTESTILAYKKYILDNYLNIQSLYSMGSPETIKILYTVFHSVPFHILGNYHKLRYDYYQIAISLPMEWITEKSFYFFKLSLMGSAITYYETVIKYGLPDLGYLHLKLSLQLYHDLLDDKEEAKHSIYRQFWKEEQKQYGKEQCYETAKSASRIFSTCYGSTDDITVLATNLVLQIEEMQKRS